MMSDHQNETGADEEIPPEVVRARLASPEYKALEADFARRFASRVTAEPMTSASGLAKLAEQINAHVEGFAAQFNAPSIKQRGSEPQRPNRVQRETPNFATTTARVSMPILNGILANGVVEAATRRSSENVRRASGSDTYESIRIR